MFGKQDDESLSPQIQQEIERQFEQTATQTRRFAAALVHYSIRGVVIVVVLLALAFTFDYIQFRRNPNALGSVTVNRYYAVTLKNKKTDYSAAEPEIQTCVNSVFPHFGYSPCWYLRRHNVKEIDI
jgi:hypothetical protein